MATATKIKAGRSRGRAGAAAPASLAFAISQDNRGEYLWEIVDDGGNGLVRSGGFASRDDAERAAHYVHDSARLARFERREPSERDTSGA